jgi:hypothetical protein
VYGDNEDVKVCSSNGFSSIPGTYRSVKVNVISGHNAIFDLLNFSLLGHGAI